MNGIFLQGLGFLLLIAPFALLCYVPFEKSAFRPGRTAACVAIAVLLAVMAAGFSLLHLILADEGNIQFRGTLYMAVSILAYIAAYCLVVRDAMVKKIIALSVSIVGGITEYHMASLLLYHMLPIYPKYATDSYMFTLPGVICYFLLDLFMVPLLFGFFRKTLRKYLRETLSEEINRHLPFFASTTFLYLAAAFVIGVNDRYENALENLPGRLLMSGFAILCVLEAYRFLFQEIEQNRERNEFRHLLEIQRLQFEKLTGDIEHTRRIRHDMKYLLRSLGTLVSDGHTDEALELIRQESDHITLDEQHNYCREPFLNGLLQHYAGKMEDAGICFRLNIRMETSPIPVSELLVLVGNLLENALEACKANDGQAFVKLNAGIVNSMLVFYMENSCGEIFYENRFAAEAKQKAGQWLSARDFHTRKSGGVWD